MLLNFFAVYMPKDFIVNPEEDPHKRNSKTASGNSMLFFFPLLLFLHIKQLIDFNCTLLRQRSLANFKTIVIIS